MRSLGNEDFIWLCSIELCIGILVAFLQRSGAIGLFRERASRIVTTRKPAGVTGWALGVSVFFSGPGRIDPGKLGPGPGQTKGTTLGSRSR